MANDEHVALLKQGVDAWNAWRNQNPERQTSGGGDLRQASLTNANLNRASLSTAHLTSEHLISTPLFAADLKEAGLKEADLSGANLPQADLKKADLRIANLGGAKLAMANLSGANLYGARLTGANLWYANLREANLSEANLDLAILYGADLTGADLSGADLRQANLPGADLSGANLYGASLTGANLREANLRDANLKDANLQVATLVGTDVTGADLTGCRIYGVSAWRLKLENTKQQNLVITRGDEPTVTVDNIEVAQFIYLMLNYEKVRDVIDTITSKAVLILGRFTADRKAVLDALRDELRNRNLLPILFDFAIPARRDVTETIKTLASLARFVIADATDATEVRVELHNIVRDFPSLPIQPILLRGHPEFVSLPHLRNFPWVLPIFEYDHPEHLLASLGKIIVAPEAKVKALKEALEEGRRKIEAELTKPQ
jgi:uncharacterized protein YjbI with pentapeptide repeats